ncbi:MAG: single-stranded DNA-binding protein [Anaerolineae bacterium]|nr:single-stranded DNA-binding protein [Anaerolineae bacterium]MCO5193150.1 single-stranded DNA-binding protein [Anaerolineae bacterium]
MSYQKITIAGNLGREPEMRYMPDGTAVTNLNVATNRSWSNADGERVQETTWFRVSLWGKRAEVANQYLSKGDKVLVEGRLQADSATGGPRLWQRQDGTMSASFEIRATDFAFLNSSSHNGSAEPVAAGANGYGGHEIEEDDIPF